MAAVQQLAKSEPFTRRDLERVPVLCSSGGTERRTASRQLRDFEGLKRPKWPKWLGKLLATLQPSTGAAVWGPQWEWVVRPPAA